MVSSLGSAIFIKLVISSGEQELPNALEYLNKIKKIIEVVFLLSKPAGLSDVLEVVQRPVIKERGEMWNLVIPTHNR